MKQPMKQKNGLVIGIAALLTAAMFIFAGCGDGGSGDSTSPPSGPTLYTVTFNGNGFASSVPVALTQAAEGETVTLPAATADGGSVVTWNTQADGNGTDIVAGSYTPAANITLYVKVTSFSFVTGQENNHDIKAKFGITNTTVVGVTAAFKAVHQHISNANFASGDYIDLPSLTIGATKIDDKELSGHGRLLRLIMVGKNSFNGKHGNNTPHVVFQFRNVPLTRTMNTDATNVGGYAGSAMKTYLMGDFLTGLKAAGVPESVLWAPFRRVWNGWLPGEMPEFPPEGPPEPVSKNTAVNTITDALWLPTVWEMFGNNDGRSSTSETGANQARLEYYADNPSRIKYNNSNSAVQYWLASPDSGSPAHFRTVLGNSYSFISFAHLEEGCAPAFCVK